MFFLEDKPYRSIVNGVQILPNVKYDVMDIKNPCGGWGKVFDALEKNLHLVKNPECNILLLMDFDDKDDSLSTFESRKNKLSELAPLQYSERVFILGVNHKESEALIKLFGTPKFEQIGQELVKDCPSGDLSNWRNIHLECNLPEIERMRENGIFDWLFC